MLAKSIIILAFLSLISSCAEDDSTSKEMSRGIAGVWQGIQKQVSSEGEQLTEVSLAFFADGRFELRERDGDRFAEGVYEDYFRLSSLTLRFQSSTMTDLALAGSIFDFEYELHENELLLRGQRVIFRLKRPEDPVEGDELNGYWYCQDSQAQSWQLMTLGHEFQLYLKRSGQASIMMKGEMKWEDGAIEGQESRSGQWLVKVSQPVRIYDGFEVTIERDKDQKLILHLRPWRHTSPGESPQTTNPTLSCQA